ncbi:MAG: hypothetical protein O7C74_02045 [Acidobacteria bacterium]|nr:hypothetical protein [Acidobacteriota bacterium]
MKKTLIAVALLLPAMAMAQEKYTNDDLDIAPKRDAYTNADIRKLAPLPVTGSAVAAEPMPVVAADRAALAMTARRDEMFLDLDMLNAEIGYWEDVIDTAFRGVGGINDYPRIGRDTAEARERIIRLRRHIYLVEEELARLR